MQIVSERDLLEICNGLFTTVGVPLRDSRIAARCMVNANLRGIDGQGARRLRQHISMIRAGTINPRPNISVIRERMSACLLDGDYGLGSVVSTTAMEHALRRSDDTGVAIVSVRNTNDFGMAANYAMLALERDCIGIAMTNTLPWVAPHGGRARVLGTNPIAIAIPAGSGSPIVFDFSTSYVSHSKIVIQKELGN